MSFATPSCVPLFHNWSAWSPLIPDYTGGWKQIRCCRECNKVQLRSAISMFRAHLTDGPLMNQMLHNLRYNSALLQQSNSGELQKLYKN